MFHVILRKIAEIKYGPMKIDRWGEARRVLDGFADGVIGEYVHLNSGCLMPRAAHARIRGYAITHPLEHPGRRRRPTAFGF